MDETGPSPLKRHRAGSFSAVGNFRVGTCPATAPSLAAPTLAASASLASARLSAEVCATPPSTPRVRRNLGCKQPDSAKCAVGAPQNDSTALAAPKHVQQPSSSQCSGQQLRDASASRQILNSSYSTVAGKAAAVRPARALEGTNAGLPSSPSSGLLASPEDVLAWKFFGKPYLLLSNSRERVVVGECQKHLAHLHRQWKPADPCGLCGAPLLAEEQLGSPCCGAGRLIVSRSDFPAFNPAQLRTTWGTPEECLQKHRLLVSAQAKAVRNALVTCGAVFLSCCVEMIPMVVVRSLP